jgi:hypothetical protein
LIFGVLKASYEIFTLNNDFAHWAIVLIAHPRAALFMQQRWNDTFSLLVAVWMRTGMATSPNDKTPVPGEGMYLP